MALLHGSWPVVPLWRPRCFAVTMAFYGGAILFLRCQTLNYRGTMTWQHLDVGKVQYVYLLLWAVLAVTYIDYRVIDWPSRLLLRLVGGIVAAKE